MEAGKFSSYARLALNKYKLYSSLSHQDIFRLFCRAKQKSHPVSRMAFAFIHQLAEQRFRASGLPFKIARPRSTANDGPSAEAPVVLLSRVRSSVQNSPAALNGQ
jgi:hypothetical protein